MIFIMRKINTISRCGVMYRGDKINSNTLKPNYHSFAILISKNPGILQEEISKRLCINKSNVTRTLDALESDGFICRVTNPEDKRSQKIYPTDKLTALMPKVFEVARNWNTYLTEDISDDELNVFQKVLNKIADRAHLYVENRGIAENENLT